jgi:hypothetical protein
MERNIKEYNYKIAKFVGAYLEPHRELNAYKWSFKDKDNPFKKLFGNKLTIAELHFHDDWNWIMPVLKMIQEKGCIPSVSFCVDICTCNIAVISKDSTGNFIVHDNKDGRNPIDPVYDAICDYVDYIEK